MKRISLLKIMAFGVLALVHTACENAKYDVIDNLVYINEASTSKTKELTLTEVRAEPDRRWPPIWQG